MRFIKKLLIGIILAVAFMVAISLLLPREVDVSREITIDAPPSAVFPYVNDLKRFNDWAPWAEFDPNTSYTYEGPASGKGQKVTWSSEHPNVGNGTQEITLSEPDERVETALDFGDMGTANAAFDLTPVNEGTRVSWQFHTDLGMNPVARWMGLMFDSWIGADYEKGLAKLKRTVEAETNG